MMCKYTDENKYAELYRSKADNTQWKQLHTEVKQAKIIVVNCPGLVRMLILKMN